MSEEEHTILTLDELVAQGEYWGRFIAIGTDPTGENNVVVYFITGRSPPSRARTLLFLEETGTIYTEPTDPKQIEKGSPSLLIYPAIMQTPNGDIAVSNGVQTNLIYSALRNDSDKLNNAEAILRSALDTSFWVHDKKYGLIDVTSFEPDFPNNTARISAAIEKDDDTYTYGLAFARKGEDGEVDKQYFGVDEIVDEPGNLATLATYSGKNVPSGVVIPNTNGIIRARLNISGIKNIAESVNEAMGPKHGEGILKPGDDHRVCLVVVMQNKETGETEHYIINKYEKAVERGE